MSPQKKIQKEKIASTMKELESIVRRFEDGDIGIEEGIAEYKKAATLIKVIKKQLTAAQLKIRRIKKSVLEE